MKALRFRSFIHLRWEPIATFILVVASVSMLSTATATILQGFYRCFRGYLGGGEGIIALYDMGSSTPFTGLVSSRIADYLASIDGVLAFSMEILAPCIVYGEPMIARGVYLDDFLKLTGIDIIDGCIPSSDDLRYALIGFRAASRLRVEPGVKLLVLGVLSDRYVEVKVEAVYRSDTALDDEIIVPIHVGRWIRGVGDGSVTLFRVKIDESKLSLGKLTEELSSRIDVEDKPPHSGSLEPPKHPTPIYGYIPTTSGLIGVSTIERYMERYMEPYGLTGWSITLLSVSTVIFASLTIVAAFRMMIERHRAELTIFRFLGLSRRDLKIGILLKLTPCILLSSLIGFASGLALVEVLEFYGLLRILSYTVSAGFYPATLPVSIASTMLLAILSIAWSDAA
ncbi:MAG: FtsX-like permease family protein [Nitrososphaerota archaeon]|nr:hypothetical protein [Candidatus Bathyarchaeota archaeon]MDW8061663.1 FtsX-like permease family protein [Nitrososphaerota archaeon]